MQNRDERVRAASELCIAMLDEAKADDEPERNGKPIQRYRERRHGEAPEKVEWSYTR